MQLFPCQGMRKKKRTQGAHFGRFSSKRFAHLPWPYVVEADLTMFHLTWQIWLACSTSFEVPKNANNATGGPNLLGGACTGLWGPNPGPACLLWQNPWQATSLDRRGAWQKNNGGFPGEKSNIRKKSQVVLPIMNPSYKWSLRSDQIFLETLHAHRHIATCTSRATIRSLAVGRLQGCTEVGSKSIVTVYLEALRLIEKSKYTIVYKQRHLRNLFYLWKLHGKIHYSISKGKNCKQIPYSTFPTSHRFPVWHATIPNSTWSKNFWGSKAS